MMAGRMSEKLPETMSAENFTFYWQRYLILRQKVALFNACFSFSIFSLQHSILAFRTSVSLPYPVLKTVSACEILESDVTVLIPAALENQINADNADRIRAKVIVEGANGPTTVEADDILEKKGVVLVPDILANSGGVVVSYFEWVQNLQSLEWEESVVNDKLAKKMQSAFDDVYSIAKEKNVTLRTGAYLIALKRVVETLQYRGIWP